MAASSRTGEGCVESPAHIAPSFSASLWAILSPGLVKAYISFRVLINVNDAVFIKEAPKKDSPEGSLIAVSKMNYSETYLKRHERTKGMYWREVLWKYH